MDDAVNLLARYVANTIYEKLPPRVVELTKLFVLDAMGTMIAGSTAPGCEGAVNLVKDWDGKPESSIGVLGDAVPAPDAALVNAMMSHALRGCSRHLRRGGVLSAFLARSGIKGPSGVMDGKHGFFELSRRGATVHD